MEAREEWVQERKCQWFLTDMPQSVGHEASGIRPIRCSILLIGSKLFLHLRLKMEVLMLDSLFA